MRGIRGDIFIDWISIMTSALKITFAAGLIAAAVAVPLLSDAGTTHHKKTVAAVSCNTTEWTNGNASSRNGSSKITTPAPGAKTDCTAKTSTGTDAATTAAQSTAPATDPVNTGATGDPSGTTGTATPDATNTDSVAGMRTASSSSSSITQ